MINLSNRRFRYVALFLVVAIMAMCSNTFAIGVSGHFAPHTAPHATTTAVNAANIALRAATAGKVTPPTPALDAVAAASRGASAVCLWQIPGILTYINLYALTTVQVLGENQNYRTEVATGGLSGFSIKLKPGEDIRTHINLIEKRLKECSEGK